MTNGQDIVHPDISDLLARKAARRRELARLPLGEKIAMMERLRERLAPLKRAREERRARQAAAAKESPGRR